MKEKVWKIVPNIRVKEKAYCLINKKTVKRIKMPRIESRIIQMTNQ